MRPIVAAPLASLLALSLAAAGPIPAAAHVLLVDSFPSAKQRLPAAPGVVRLRFSGRADALYSTISLEGEGGGTLATRTQPAASRDLQLPAPPLPPGSYRIRYRVLSTDGDLVEGRVEFTVESAAEDDKRER